MMQYFVVFSLIVPVTHGDLHCDLCTFVTVQDSLLQHNTRADHVSGLFLLLPLSISHNDTGLICGGGVKEAQSEGLSLYSAQPHTHI